MWEAALDDTLGLYDDIFSPSVVMARVGHLDRTKRHDIERITRIIREGFDGAGVMDPKPRIARILLVGPYARRTWTRDDETAAVPAYEIWIVVNDRLFTHHRLWQAIEARIRDALGDRCTVSLSFTTARGVRTGKATGDEFIVDRLNAGITLFHAMRDAPLSRRRKGRAVWLDALARFDAADAAFRPATERYRDADRLRFGEHDQASSLGEPASAGRRELDVARAEEKRLGDALHEATMALLHTPAPDLAAVIRKLELVRDVGDGDDHATISILADLRWVAARLAAIGTPS
jgi:hypothetical protein